MDAKSMKSFEDKEKYTISDTTSFKFEYVGSDGLIIDKTITYN